MNTVSARPAPTLSRFVLPAAVWAILAHLFVAYLFLVQPPSDGGGGGQVLGQLSVSLGGTGAAGPPERVEMEPVLETEATTPSPRVEKPRPKVMERPSPKPRVIQPQTIRPQAVQVPRVREPAEQLSDVSPSTGNNGDGNPVGAASAGAPTLGEGAVSDFAGVGSTDAAAGDLRDAYLAMIRARVEKNRTYPSAARRRREEGMVVLNIAIDAQGQLVQAEVMTGSGSFHLDRAAKRMVEKSSPFPAPPNVPFTTQIPINFALR